MLFTAGNKKIYAFIKHYAACTHILYDCNEPIPRNQQVNPRLHLPWPPGTELRFLLHWAAERASFGRQVPVSQFSLHQKCMAENLVEV